MTSTTSRQAVSGARDDLPTGRRVRVLHVTEAYAGGVKTAISSYVRAVPEVAHFLLATTGRSESKFTVPDGLFLESTELPRGALASTFAIRARVRSWKPDIIHAHSSFAGAYVRLALRNKKRRPIIYTPHGFGFERLDLPYWKRNLIWITEDLLSANTAIIAGCSTRETRLATRMLAHKTRYLPNVAGADVEMHSGERFVLRPPEGPLVVACMGRIAPQRDPQFVIDTWRLMKGSADTDQEWRMIWIGDGDSCSRRDLEQAGIEVTGWVDRGNLVDHLLGVDVLFHPGRWDGFPVAILEANRLGIPIVARRSPALQDGPDAVLAKDSLESATMIGDLLRDSSGTQWRANLKAWSTYLECNDRPHQRAVLLDLYRVFS